MKIIKPAVKLWRKAWVGECRACGCEAEAEPNELHSFVTDRTDGTEMAHAHCPCCDNHDVVFYLRTRIGGAS